MGFTQTMTVQADSAQALAELIEGWHRDQAGTAPGYRGARVLADRDAPGRYVIEVDFTSQEEAEQNNTRPETQAWAERLQGATDGTPEYRNYEVAYTTG
jgi:quinol monooxygenase YgiN